MLKRTFAIAVVLVSRAFLIESQQGSRSRKSKRSSTTDQRAKRNPPPVITFAKDTGGRELIVRVLDVGEGDAIYIRNGSSRVLIDGGPQEAARGRYLDLPRLNHTTIDVVILTHPHLHEHRRPPARVR